MRHLSPAHTLLSPSISLSLACSFRSPALARSRPPPPSPPTAAAASTRSEASDKYSAGNRRWAVTARIASSYGSLILRQEGIASSYGSLILRQEGIASFYGKKGH